MPAPPWLQNVLVVVGRSSVKAFRHGMREGAANAIDSVLEDVQGLTDEIGRRIKSSRSTLRKPKTRKPPPRKRQEPPEVIEAEIIDEGEE